ncbi:hypothetical protein [Embleya scabrispora]|uniref:hypothetical protein n=1 Tax=Embleya scabrispora TaxID=159449 RepID=UPI00117E51FA|nr:hypothetical protein [Embleya scabrispora]
MPFAAQGAEDPGWSAPRRPVVKGFLAAAPACTEALLGGDPDPEAQAMCHALGAVARGFAPATPEALARDGELALATEQRARTDDLVIELDTRTLDILANA